jgi:hypothetical protein
MAINTPVICLGREAKYFCAEDWTTQITLKEFRNFFHRDIHIGRQNTGSNLLIQEFAATSRPSGRYP